MQVALAWITRRPGVASTLIGATRLDQLDENLNALEVQIPDELSKRLEAVGRPEQVHPYLFFERTLQGMISGGTTIRREQPWYRPRP